MDLFDYTPPKYNDRPFDKGKLNIFGKNAPILGSSFSTKETRSGMSFKELRVYSPGDQTKHIHWKATAKTGMPHIKIYEEELHQKYLIALDTSASMLAGFETPILDRAFNATYQLMDRCLKCNHPLQIICKNISQPGKIIKKQDKVLTINSLESFLKISRKDTFEIDKILELNPRDYNIIIITDGSWIINLKHEALAALTLLRKNNKVFFLILSQMINLPTDGLYLVKDCSTNQQYEFDLTSQKVRDYLQLKEDERLKIIYEKIYSIKSSALTI